MILSQIFEKYKDIPYYNDGNYISINDDRMGRIVSFKIYQENNKIMADFKEAHRSDPLNTSSRYKTVIIESVKDFDKKWISYYNFN